MIKDRAAATVRVFDSPAQMGAHLAKYLLQRIDQSRRAEQRFLLGCPTGRTPRPVYDSLAERLEATRSDLSHVTLVMMDEYLARSRNGFDWAPASAAWSCHHFARVEITERLNRALTRDRQLQQESVWFPDPADPSSYDKKIADAGGIDFFILASGASDGHVAFNPPGSPRQSRTRIVELPESTRRDNLQTFPAFGTLASVPTHGISVGIATITSAKEAAMLLWGKSKAESFRRVVAADRYNADWPATVIHECARARILTDADAAGESAVAPG